MFFSRSIKIVKLVKLLCRTIFRKIAHVSANFVKARDLSRYELTGYATRSAAVALFHIFVGVSNLIVQGLW